MRRLEMRAKLQAPAPVPEPKPELSHTLKCLVNEAPKGLDSSSVFEWMNKHSAIVSRFLEQCVLPESCHALRSFFDKRQVNELLEQLMHSISRLIDCASDHPGLQYYQGTTRIYFALLKECIELNDYAKITERMASTQPLFVLIDSDTLEISYPTFAAHFEQRAIPLITEFHRHARQKTHSRYLAKSTTSEEKPETDYAVISQEAQEFYDQFRTYQRAECSAPGHSFHDINERWLDKVTYVSNLPKLINNLPANVSKKNLPDLIAEYELLTEKKTIPNAQTHGYLYRLNSGVRRLAPPLVSGTLTFLGLTHFAEQKKSHLTPTDYLSAGFASIAVSVFTYSAPVVYSTIKHRLSSTDATAPTKEVDRPNSHAGKIKMI